MITLTGQLRQVSDGSYYMDCTNGTVITVLFNGKEHSDQVPINRLIALSVIDLGENVMQVSGSVPCYIKLEESV
jgi:hypothetical protein